MRSKKIMFWDDERALCNGIIVTLQYGWKFSEDGEHVKGFDTVSDANESVRAARKCKCPECAER